MDRFRGSRFGAPSSKASASTVCQKCLKRGHYSYECKATVQDRPYISRPSRTQQLLNPKLAPKLNDENPNKLLDKKGIADEILAAKEAESRGHKRSLDDLSPSGPRKRSRSLSSYTSDSVSTISTDASRSPSRSRSPPSKRGGRASDYASPRRQVTQRGAQYADGDKGKKRQRRASSAYDSLDRSSRDSRSQGRGSGRERDARTRRSSASPSRRSRRRSRSWSDSRSPSRSFSEDQGDRGKKAASRRRARSYSTGSEDHKVTGRGAKGSNAEQARGRTDGRRRAPSHSRSRSRSPFKKGSAEQADDRGPVARSTNDRGGGASGYNERPPARVERSLSPFSKRVAMTRAMAR